GRGSKMFPFSGFSLRRAALIALKMLASLITRTNGSSTRPPAAAPEPPKGSPLGVLLVLLRKDRWFPEAEICRILHRKLSTLKPDFRALVHHLRLARSALAGKAAYRLLDEVRKYNGAIRIILEHLQKSARRHYRPSISELIQARRKKIDPFLGRSPLPKRGTIYHETYIGAVQLMLAKSRGLMDGGYFAYKKEHARLWGRRFDGTRV